MNMAAYLRELISALAHKTRRFPQLEARGTAARGRDDAGVFINEHVFSSRWRR